MYVKQKGKDDYPVVWMPQNEENRGDQKVVPYGVKYGEKQVLVFSDQCDYQTAVEKHRCEGRLKISGRWPWGACSGSPGRFKRRKKKGILHVQASMGALWRKLC